VPLTERLTRHGWARGRGELATTCRRSRLSGVACHPDKVEHGGRTELRETAGAAAENWIALRRSRFPGDSPITEEQRDRVIEDPLEKTEGRSTYKGTAARQASERTYVRLTTADYRDSVASSTRELCGTLANESW